MPVTLLNKDVSQRLRPEAVMIGTSLACLVFLLIAHAPVMYTDVWMHLKYGYWIQNNGALPNHELFVSWSSPHESWKPTAWLSQWLFAQVHSWGMYFRLWDITEHSGTVALRLLHAFVVAFRTIILFLAFCRMSQSTLAGTLATLLALGLDWVSLFVLRPQIFGELGLAFFLLALSRPVPTRLAWLLFPPILALWANCHGSFLVGLLLLLGALAGQFFQTIAANGGIKKLRFRHLFYSIGLRRTFEMFYVSILLIGLFNPAGFAIYSNAWSVSFHPNVQTMDEWQPMHFQSPWFAFFGVSLIVLLGTFFFSWVQRNRVPGEKNCYPIFNVGQLLIMGIFGLQVILHQRMMPWWAMLVPYLCVGIWGCWFSKIPVSQADDSPAYRRRVRLARVAAVAMAALAIWYSSAFKQLDLGKAVGQLYHPVTPQRLVKTLEPVSATVTVFASETVAEYLAFRLPMVNIVCHTHVQNLPVEHWQNCLIVKNGLEGTEQLLKKWNVRFVAVEPWAHPRLCELMRKLPGWQVVSDGSIEPLFVAMKK